MVKITEVTTTTTRQPMQNNARTSKRSTRRTNVVSQQRKQRNMPVQRINVSIPGMPAKITRNDTGRMAMRNPPNRTIALTIDGESFLKAAFAPPDFAHIQMAGIPDEFNGPTLATMDTIVTGINEGGYASKGTDIFILCTPTPGIACWIATAGLGQGPQGLTWKPVRFPGYDTLIPADWTTNPTTNPLSNFSEFRTVSLAIELVNNDPALTASGSISVMKVPLSLTTTNDGTIEVAGDEAFNAIMSRPGSTWHWKDGAYSIGLNMQPDFEFKTFKDIHYDINNSNVVGTGGNLFSALQYGWVPPPAPAPFPQATPLVGFGTLESILVKVSGFDAGQTAPPYITNFTARVWQANEFKVSGMSLLYPFVTASPSLDSRAMKSYRDMTSLVPIAVRACDNDNFWSTLLKYLGMAAGALGTFIPGPWGIASTVVGVGASALSRVVGNWGNTNSHTHRSNRKGYPGNVTFADYGLD